MAMASVQSKVFAITGGGSGIGAATAQLLVERGASVICIADVCSQGLERTKALLEKINSVVQLHCAKVDVSSATQVEQWLQAIIVRFKTLDGVANVAGIAQGAGLRDHPAILGETDEEWRRTMAVNLDGVFHCTRGAVRAMKDLPNCHRSIVNVSSIASVSHMPDVYAYGTSKGACAYFTTAVATDVFPLGIRVNTVSPGITDTPLLPQFMPRAGGSDQVKEAYAKEGFTVIQPEDVARVIVWLLSNDSWPVYGANINVGAAMP